MKLNYFSVAAECNVYRIKVRHQLIGKILSNILKCASALFYATRWPYLLTKKNPKKTVTEWRISEKSLANAYSKNPGKWFTFMLYYPENL